MRVSILYCAPLLFACLYSHNIVSSLKKLTEFAKKINSRDPQALFQMTSSEDFFGKSRTSGDGVQLDRFFLGDPMVCR